jgi:hypothetical protein
MVQTGEYLLRPKNLSQYINNLENVISDPKPTKRIQDLKTRSVALIRGFLTFSWVQRNLSYYVNLQRSRMLKLSRQKRLVDYLKRQSSRIEGFITSKWSFIGILLLLVLFFIFPIDSFIYNYLQFPALNNDFYLTLWQVYGAIVGLSFVALFFSYEAFFSRISSTFKNQEFRFRQEFYRETFVQPLLFFNLFSLVYVGIVINTSQKSQSVILLVTSILSICLLFAKAVSFFESEKMEKTRLRILQSEIVDSINSELDRRLSTNLLLKISEKHENIKFELFSIQEKNRKQIQLNVSERKRISNIAIDNMVSAIQPRKIYLKKTIGDIVSPQYNVVGAVPDEVDDKTVKRLQKYFKLKNEPVRKDLHLAFDDIAQQLQNAKNEGNSREFERLLELYYRSLEKFLSTLHLYGIKYAPDTAKTGDFLHEWEPIYEIQQDFFHLLENSVGSSNKEIIRAEVYFIRDILELSNEYDDYLIFNRFKDFWTTIFYLALEVEDKATRKSSIDLLLNAITEFVASHLLLHVAHSEMNIEQVQKYGEFATLSVALFEQMLKATIEAHSLEEFQRIKSKLDLILSNFDPENDRPLDVEIEASLMNPSLSSSQKMELSKKLEVIKSKVELKQKLEKLLLEIWFGIGGWVCQLFSKKKYSQLETLEFLKMILPYFKTLQNLKDIYSGVESLTPSFAHAWQWWDTQDTPPGIVVGLSGEQWLGRFYCLAAIPLTPKEIGDDVSLKPTRDSTGILNIVMSMCQEIITNAPIWSSVLCLSDEELILRANNLVKIHERTVQKQREIEIRKTISQSLEEQKIIEFKDKVTTAWKNSTQLRDVVNKLGNYTDKAAVVEAVPLIARHQWVPKNEFVKDSQAMVVGVEHIGQVLGRDENSKILSSFILRAKNCTVSMDNLMVRVFEIMEEMKTRDVNANIIITGSRKIIRAFLKSENYTPYWGIKDSTDVKISGYEGNLADIPVFFIHELEGETVCLIDLRIIGTFIQYRVKEGDEDILHFEIGAVDENKARELIKANPKNLQNEKGGQITEAQAIERLQQVVSVVVSERFEFSVKNENASYLVKIDGDNAKPN